MSDAIVVKDYGSMTDPQQVALVMSMSARGDAIKTIQRVLLDKFGAEYSLRTIVNFRKRNRDAIAVIREASLNNEMSRAEHIVDNSLRRIKRRLDKTAEDEAELEALEEEYRAGEIEYDEYKRRKTGLKALSINDLVLTAKEANNIVQKSRKISAPSLPDPDDPRDTPGDPAMVNALLTAIQRGDTVSMLQIKPNE